MSVKDRLTEYLAFKGITKTLFSQTIGVSNAYITSIRKSIQPDKIKSIALNYPDLNTEWLLTGEGGMIKERKTEVTPVINPNVIMVPLVSKYAYAGYIAGYGDDEYVDNLPKLPFIIPEETTPHGEYMAFEVKGDSMDNESPESLVDGDMLLCRLIKKELWRDYRLHIRKWNFVIVTREGIVCKRIKEHDLEKGTITIHSLNPLYKDETVSVNDILEIFNVVQLMRKPIL